MYLIYWLKYHVNNLYMYNNKDDAWTDKTTDAGNDKKPSDKETNG